MTMKCVLSDWELQELVVLRGRGWSCKKLAAWYGVSDRTIQRILRKMEQERRGECLTEYR
jgi:transposase